MNVWVRRVWWFISGPVLAVAVSVSAAWLIFDDYRSRPPTLLDVELALLMGLPLAWRRRFPAGVLIIVAGAVIGIALTRREEGTDQLAVLLALAAVARRKRWWQVGVATAIAAGALAFATVKSEFYVGEADQFVWIPIATGVAVVGGAILRRWDARGAGINGDAIGEASEADPRPISTRQRARRLPALAAAMVLIIAAHGPLQAAVFGPSQFADRQWQHRSRDHGIEAVVTAADGDVFALELDPDNTLILVRYAADGRRRWTRSLSKAIRDADGAELAATADGGAVVAFGRNNPGSPPGDGPSVTALVIRTDNEGRTVWERSVSGEQAVVFDVASASNGTVAVVGSHPASSGKTGPNVAFAEVFTTAGATAWRDEFRAADGALASAAVFDGDRLVAAGSRDTGKEVDAFVRTYLPDGELVRDDIIDVDDVDVVTDLAISPDGSLVTALQSADSFATKDLATSTVRSTRPDGSLRWEETLTGAESTAEVVAITSDGDVIVAGNRPRRLWGLDLNMDVAVYRWDKQGRRRPGSLFGTRRDDVLGPGLMAVTGDGDLLLAQDEDPNIVSVQGVVTRLRPPWK